MGRIIQTFRRTTVVTTRRAKKVPAGYHRCPNCGGDGICKNQKRTRTKRKS